LKRTCPYNLGQLVLNLGIDLTLSLSTENTGFSMADQKGGDTDFRRTFNREDAAARGAERERKEREEGKARYEAKLEGKKYHRRASTPPDARETEARSARLDVASMIGKTMLVSIPPLGYCIPLIDCRFLPQRAKGNEEGLRAFTVKLATSPSKITFNLLR
jgi:hypothetical protein